MLNKIKSINLVCINLKIETLESQKSALIDHTNVI